MSKRARTNPSLRSRFWFVVVLVVAPIAALAAAEWLCRARGYGGYPPVIERVGPDGGREWYATNRGGTDTYFYAQQASAGGMREIQFTTPKPDNTVRIIFLGESAIQGFPQQLPLTNGSFLEAMLSDLWRGERRVEVLNLGATAVASFPVARFVEDVLDHEPNLIVLMAGSNEFYGAYGVASLNPVARSPLGMRTVRWARSLALAQWLQSSLHRETPESGTLMERVSSGRAIAHDDPLRRAATVSLRANLRESVRRCVARNVPVIVCTVPTNESGLAPIGVDSNGARQARAHFDSAEALTRAGKHDDALPEYVRARDLDAMPWRATSAANDAVREAAAAGATLCDMEAAFRAASGGRAIGWDLMDDHVHMSVRGQALFARTIATAMTSMAPPLTVNAEELAALPSWEDYAARLGHSVYSDFVAATHVQKLFAIPFMRRNNEEAFHRFDARGRDLLEAMSDLDRAAVAQWRDPSLHGASERPLEFVVGAYRMRAGDYASAADLFRVARAGVPVASSWRLELDWYLLRCNRNLHAEPTDEDRALCMDAIAVGELVNRYSRAGDPRVLRFLGLAYNLAGNHSGAIAALEPIAPGIRGTDGWEVVAALFDSYIQTGQRDLALRVLALASQDPEMAEAARGLAAHDPEMWEAARELSERLRPMAP
ncbi:MAG: hypothetical protein ACKVU1_10700 [bacterium]